ncbi:MAG: alginate export family protein, partial [Nitrospinota bacterium]|nr:alginate export family protein [Nitrospinota bacterium]
MEWSKFTRLFYLCAAFFLGGVFLLPDRPVTAGETLSPPSYNSSRYLEDYRYLKDPARRTDFWDPIKYIPLDDAGTVYLSLGGETRQHYESIRNENWG